jgi:hydroxymethylglutaryl-CoA reductase
LPLVIQGGKQSLRHLIPLAAVAGAVVADQKAGAKFPKKIKVPIW